MTGAGDCHGRNVPLAPVGPISVFDLHGDRSAGCSAVQDTAGQVDAVPLNLHPPSASVTLLAPAQLEADLILDQGQAGRNSFNDGSEAGPMRFAGRQKA